MVSSIAGERLGIFDYSALSFQVAPDHGQASSQFNFGFMFPSVNFTPRMTLGNRLWPSRRRQSPLGIGTLSRWTMFSWRPMQQGKIMP
jgi:hypothetical protein